MDQPDTREWLTTNGLGGYASGTVCGANSRRYHGLLVAAIEPPGQRTVLLSRVDETVIAGGDVYELGASFWRSGWTAPEGYRQLAAFRPDPVPTWEYRVGLGRLVKRVASIPGQNATAIRYHLEGGPPIRLEVTLLANHRDFHGNTAGHPDWQFRQEVRDEGLRVDAWNGAAPWYAAWSNGAEYRQTGQWYWGYRYPEEESRGLPSVEDNYCLGTVGIRLRPGEALDLMVSVDPVTDLVTVDEIAHQLTEQRRQLVQQSTLPRTLEAEALVTAGDQFLVRRASTHGSTVIAGYHWFGDWGRDTMIALPGLTLTTKRFSEAAEILRTFAAYVDRGMLPNRFPDEAETPEYNTVDATLWWFHALDAYRAASGDDGLAREQLPLLQDVIEWHVRGTRYGIKMDPEDGLLLAGEPGVQLTWMDARVGDHVVTPRSGKPVEVNALWLNALCVAAELTERYGRDASHYREMARKTRIGMQRFWSAPDGYLFDVLGEDGVGDSTLRPNQLFACSLPHTAFSVEQVRSILGVIEKHLLIPFGLRSLNPSDLRYVGKYQGDVAARDGSYHQGTAWPWLIGAYADTLIRARGATPETSLALRELVRPLLGHLMRDGCLGSISEIFDADPPHTARGAVAQAWSVAELLRVYALAHVEPTAC
ncbi:MAG: amylo-alpha-1,6-glucosidase [Chloroflexota bacterium]